MPIAQGLTTSFKQNLLNGLENFTTGHYRIALYTADANIGNQTTVYSNTNEVVGDGYSEGGAMLSVIPPASNVQANTAYVSFYSVTWSPASFTAAGALIYNADTGASVCVLNFGGSKTAANSFTITFPPDDAANAVIRLP